MNKNRSIFIFYFILLFFFLSQGHTQNSPPSTPLGFIPNQGQFVDKYGDSAFLFAKFTDAQRREFWLTQRGLTLVYYDSLGNFSRENIEFTGASIRRENIQYVDSFPYHFNYFYPHCPQGIYGVQAYKTMRIKEVFKGIDLEFSLSEQGAILQTFIPQDSSSFIPQDSSSFMPQIKLSIRSAPASLTDSLLQNTIPPPHQPLIGVVIGREFPLIQKKIL